MLAATYYLSKMKKNKVDIFIIFYFYLRRENIKKCLHYDIIVLEEGEFVI